MRAMNTLAIPVLLSALFLLSSPVNAVAQTGLPTRVLTIQEDAAGAPSDDQVRYASREMRARVWHDKDDEEVYQRGEELHLYFRINEDAYVVMYRIDANGYADVLWPTTRFDDGFVFGGHTYSVPGRASQIPLNVSQVKGVEYVEIIASEYPFDLRELGLDFYFDVDQTTRYDHQVAGDPFLAVNDINYAITGLEEDVDWIVTDWTHIYIEEQVEYARYTCTSCHAEQDQKYQPYTNNCTQVTIYSDWGWYTGWYASFGYYPLYCDAPYYYWDRWYYRPYYYAYYPIYYGWPSCGVYVRPYPVYAWRTHPVYNGDYLVRYQRGQTHTPPLYDASPARDRSKEGDRGYTRTPPSISTRTNGNGRVNQELLVRDTAPVRSVDTRDLGDARDRTATSRVGVRTGEARPTRTVRSLQSENTARQVQPGAERVTDAGQSRSGVSAPSNSGRRWTRPVVRNERDPNAQTPSAGRVSRDTAAGRSDGGSRVSPPVDRSSEGARPAREVRSGAVQQRGDTGASTTRRDTRSVRQNNSSSTPERRTVQPRKSTSSSSGGGRQATSASRGSSRQEAAPQQRVSPPPRSGAKSGGSGGSGASPSRQSPPRSQASGRGGSRGGSSAGSRSGGGRG